MREHVVTRQLNTKAFVVIYFDEHKLLKIGEHKLGDERRC
jgi:hypothetical protein